MKLVMLLRLLNSSAFDVLPQKISLTHVVHVCEVLSPFDQSTSSEVDYHTRLLRFVTFVHMPFSVRSFDIFVASLVLMKGTSCCVIIRNF